MVGTIQVNGPAVLKGVEITGTLPALIIDELPVLAAIGPYTTSGVLIRDAKELRVKESDRIALVVQNLRAMGAAVEEFEDGLFVPGGQTLRGDHDPRCRSCGNLLPGVLSAAAGVVERLTDQAGRWSTSVVMAATRAS
jgi:5-enolpyruvylshikimate-3-phosphate synthase